MRSLNGRADDEAVTCTVTAIWSCMYVHHPTMLYAYAK